MKTMCKYWTVYQSNNGTEELSCVFVKMPSNLNLISQIINENNHFNFDAATKTQLQAVCLDAGQCVVLH